MNLSSELFEQIVSSLSGRPSPATAPTSVNAPAAAAAQATEQRSGPRVAACNGASVRLIPLTDSLAPSPFDVKLRDVAQGGARFLHSSRIALDEQFVLMFPSDDGPIAVLCGVAYWQPVAEGVFAIGAKFDRVVRQGSAAGARAVASASGIRAVAGEHAGVRRAV